MFLTHLFYSKYALWLRAFTAKDRAWLFKVAIFYVAVQFMPKLFDLRDTIFPPSRKPVILRLDREATVIVWRDLTLLFALTEIYGRKDYGEPKGDEKIIIDLGANVGLYTIYAAKRTRGKVIAVEPEPINFELLRKNVELNKLNNVILINQAVGDYNGTVKLYLASHAGGHSIFRSWVPEKNSIEVKMTTLDSLLERLNVSSVDMIKIDVENAEYLVLRGSQKSLSRCCRIAISAEHDDEIKQKCVNLLRDLGYNIAIEGYMINAIAFR